jgi:flagellar protein FliT
MGSRSEVMQCYEQIAPLTDRMLVLARSGQWGDLPALEAQNSNMVDRLKAIEPIEELNESQSARKYQLLSRITANQAEIAGIVMPQLIKLGAVLKNLSVQHSLNQTYGWTNDRLS